MESHVVMAPQIEQSFCFCFCMERNLKERNPKRIPTTDHLSWHIAGSSPKFRFLGTEYMGMYIGIAAYNLYNLTAILLILIIRDYLVR